MFRRLHRPRLVASVPETSQDRACAAPPARLPKSTRAESNFPSISWGTGVSKFRVNDARSSLHEPPHDRPQRFAISVERKVLLIDPARGRRLPACTGQMTSGMGAAQGRRETGGDFRDSHVWKA